MVSIYLWQNKRIGENGPSLMRHIYKRFFPKIEELRNYVKKKERHRNNAMNSQKNKNRPILRGKIVLIDALITTRDKKREARLYLFRFCIIIFKSIYNTHRL
jgi:hypothetical protein